MVVPTGVRPGYEGVETKPPIARLHRREWWIYLGPDPSAWTPSRSFQRSPQLRCLPRPDTASYLAPRPSASAFPSMGQAVKTQVSHTLQTAESTPNISLGVPYGSRSPLSTTLLINRDGWRTRDQQWEFGM